MKSRLAASLVLALGVVLGATGCSLMAPQTTQEHYDPSDGVSGNVGSIQVRNAMLITDGDTEANLVAVLVNKGDKTRRVEIQYRTDSGRKNQFVKVEPNVETKIDPKGGEEITLKDVQVTPGSLFPVFFQYGEQTGVQLKLPVLNNKLGSYRHLAPTPAPVTTETPAADDSSK